MLVMTFLAEQRGRALSFTDAEGDFLFAAPFNRRQLLIYKLVKGTGSALLGGCFIGLWLNPFCTLLIAPFVAGFLWGVLMDFIQVLRQLVAELFESAWIKIAGRILRGVAGLLFLIFLGTEIKIAWQLDFPEALHVVHASSLGRVVFAPARLFAKVATANLYSTFFYWGLAAALIVAFLLWIIIYLDSISTRDFGEIEILRAPKNPSAAGNKKKCSWKPQGWNGLGPIFWKQSLLLLRKFPFFTYVPMLLFIDGSIVFMRHISGEAPPIGPAIFGGMMGLSSIFVMTTMFDFRSELDHLQGLKTLPLAATAIALGEMLPMVILGTLLNFVHLALIAILLYGLRMEILGAALITPSALLLLVGFENIAFLLFPVRIKPAKASGFDEANRTVALLLGKIFVSTALILLFFGCGMYLQMNGLVSNGLFFATAFISVTTAAALMCCGVVKAFKGFDVAEDIPE